MMMAAKLPAHFQDQMVIRTGYQDDTKGLWGQIWNTLMGYINAEDTPNKLQQKESLVDLMSLFLSRVAHDSKFYLACTPAVLRASAEQATFQPLSAAQAFEALHEYAIRILAQPWRSEFAKINMYSGYYVHTVQSRLIDAHRLLEEMGFRVDAGSQTATLQEPVDVDQVTKAAIDSLMASVECRIIERILESLPPGAFTPRGVLCYRAAYVGGVEAAIHHLTVTLRQRNFQHYFSPPAEQGARPGAGGAGAAYPWQPVPPAAPPALPPVPTARLVDVGDRDTREPSHVWIPKTIRHQRPEGRSPAAAALLPATLDQHLAGSLDLVDRAGTTGPRPPPADSLDDSWGYVLNSLDRSRPASGRYDNVPETSGAPGGGQRSATLPTPRPEPRGRGHGAAAPRQSNDARASHAPLQNGSARNGAARVAPVSEQGRAGPPVTAHSPSRPAPPYESAAAAAAGAPRAAATSHAEHGAGARANPLHDHNPAPRQSLPTDFGAGGRSGALNEHSAAPRPSLVSEQSLMPRSASLVHENLAPRQTSPANSHNTTARPAAVNDRGLGTRSVPSADSRGSVSNGSSSSNGNGNAAGSGAGGGGLGTAPRTARSSRSSPRPSPALEPARPTEPRRPELGAWPTRPEPEPESEPTAEQWSCHACTYLNPVSVRVCGMCGKSRQTAGRPAADVPPAAPPVDPPDDLACPQCTLLNSRRARRCGACDVELK